MSSGAYHFAMTRTGRPIDLASATILDSDTSHSVVRMEDGVMKDETHTWDLTLRSLGRGALTPPSEGEVAG